MCSVAVSPQTVSVGDVDGETAGEEDQGRTSEEEEGGADSIYERQVSSDKCVLNCVEVEMNIHTNCMSFKYPVWNSKKKCNFIIS